ncbi:hypothetical protein WS71_11780 [Burkholderia mayonis]|uniref:Uncharacterized protein n=1 Tax=Burkholderia mayonis TaxID=1385591 RepID=A0A1B4FW84_9BURK|nr:hypothetical protein WS71_11780 [Burkholderia mayonis]KVE55408.1 hypothetical protein WS71_02875 [Burkholderia mayonis]
MRASAIVRFVRSDAEKPFTSQAACPPRATMASRITAESARRRRDRSDRVPARSRRAGISGNIVSDAKTRMRPPSRQIATSETHLPRPLRDARTRIS